MATVDKWDIDNWTDYFNFNTSEEFIAEILNGEIAIEKMLDSVMELTNGNLENAQELAQEMYYKKEQPKNLNNESGWDRHMRHMESIDKARIKKKGKMNQIKTETWVDLYRELSDFILEYSSLDDVTTIDENGTEVYTEEKQNEFMYIASTVEDIMRRSGLIKEEG